MWKRKKWTAEIKEWLDAHTPLPKGKAKTDLLNELNAKFHTNFTKNAFTSFLCSQKISLGIKPWQAGVRRGIANYNHREIGTEREKKGYIQIKTAEPDVWRMKHVVIWEQTHNDTVAPYTETVIFLDGNNRNFNPDNLYKLTRGELVTLNQKYPATSNREERLIYIALVKQRRALLKKARRAGLTDKSGFFIRAEHGSIYKERCAKDPDYKKKYAKYQNAYYHKIKETDPEKYKEMLRKKREYQKKRRSRKNTAL
jgi:hypothetical protein